MPRRSPTRRQWRNLPFSVGDPATWFSGTTGSATNPVAFDELAGRRILLFFFGSASRPDIGAALFDGNRAFFPGINDPDDFVQERLPVAPANCTSWIRAATQRVSRTVSLGACPFGLLDHRSRPRSDRRRTSLLSGKIAPAPGSLIRRSGVETLIVLALFFGVTSRRRLGVGYGFPDLTGNS
jgi:hypothetical protein